MFDADLEVGDVGVDPRHRGFERALSRNRAIITDKTRQTRGRQRAAKRACHHCQHCHGRQRGKPALAEHAGTRRGLGFRTSVVLAAPRAVAG